MDRLKEFEDNLKTNRPKLIGYIHNNLNNTSHADDILQKVSLTIWKNYEKFDPQTNFLAWAITITKFEISNFRRSFSRCPVSFNSQIYEDSVMFRKAETNENKSIVFEKLQIALNTLDESTRNLLVSVYIDKQEVKDLAKRDGKAPQTYYNKLNIAKRKLTNLLK